MDLTLKDKLQLKKQYKKFIKKFNNNKELVTSVISNYGMYSLDEYLNKCALPGDYEDLNKYIDEETNEN